MSNDGNVALTSSINTKVVVGGLVLVGVGGFIALSGLALAAGAVLSATRSWVNQRDVPPTDVARHYFDQVRSATMAGATAGANAWKNGSAQ